MVTAVWRAPSVAIWLVWLAYWVAAARGASRAQESEGRRSRGLHLSVTAVAFSAL